MYRHGAALKAFRSGKERSAHISFVFPRLCVLCCSRSDKKKWDNWTASRGRHQVYPVIIAAVYSSTVPKNAPVLENGMPPVHYANSICEWDATRAVSDACKSVSVCHTITSLEFSSQFFCFCDFSGNILVIFPKIIGKNARSIYFVPVCNKSRLKMAENMPSRFKRPRIIPGVFFPLRTKRY